MPRNAAGEPPADDRPRPPLEALATAQELIDAGRPFHAHEVLEAAWKAAPPAERDLWQGLAQIAVGLTHALRGNARGAATLLRRGADRLASYPASGPHGIDVAGLRLSCAELAARIERSGAGHLDPASVHLSLRVPDAADQS
jgi:predicted metal-dependent hydrolase